MNVTIKATQVNREVPGTIYNPTIEGIGNSEGVGDQRPVRNSGGEGDWMIDLLSR